MKQIYYCSIVFFLFLNYSNSFCQNYSELGIAISGEQNFQLVDEYKDGKRKVFILRAEKRPNDTWVQKAIAINVFPKKIDNKLEMLQEMNNSFRAKGLPTRIDDSNIRNPMLFVEAEANFGSGVSMEAFLIMRASILDNKMYMLSLGFRDLNDKSTARDIFSDFANTISFY